MKTKIFTAARILLLLILLAIFCFSAYKVASQLLWEKKEDDAFADLITRVEAERKTANQGAKGDAALLPEQGNQEEDRSGTSRLAAYVPLHEQNADLFGWIEIEGTKLNYPVMHTPEDPEYYLHRAFDGSRSNSGVPFLDGRCFEGGGIFLVYGHHMKNGTMFAAITSYAKKDFWKEHPTIRFDTLYETGTYEVIAAFYAEVYSEDEVDAFRYYAYADLSDQEVFAEYVEQVKAASLYDTGVGAEYGDQILTLSTCEYHAENGRFVVVARKAGVNHT